MSRSIQAVWVNKMGIVHPQLVGLVIHQLYKSLNRAAAVDGQSHSRIVSAVEHQAVQKVLHGHHFPCLQVHRRSLDPHSLLWNSHSIKDIGLLTDYQRCHNLGCAGNQALLIRLFFIQHTPGLSIQYNGAFR